LENAIPDAKALERVEDARGEAIAAGSATREIDRHPRDCVCGFMLYPVPKPGWTEKAHKK